MTATPTTAISYQNFFSTALTSDITSSATDIFLDNVPNGSEGFLVIEPDSESGREVIYYNSKTATKVVCPSAADGRGQDDTTAGSHLGGSTVIMAPVAAYFEALLSLFTTSPQGWTSLAGTFTSPVYNGNRSYTVTTSTDQRSVLSKGHRLKFTRTVTAPTQCTSLNGTTQYYNKTTPAAMTFTDDFVVSAWVKMTSYGAVSTIASRYNGTSGWYLYLTTSGQVLMAGVNGGAANVSYVQSYQSIPLNKWVHITAQLDMSAFTATTTTSYVMIDGVDSPAFVARAGTNPTALIQAGDLEVGANNGATNLFPGKIAQVAIYNAKVTQANIKLTIGQTLTGAETSLISAYSFNNAITDLNGSNANNLSAQGSAVATTVDSPYAMGADVVTGLTAGTTEFALLTDISSSTITVQVPEGSSIPTAGGISAASYSTYKVPYGFPTDGDKWSVATLILANVANSGSTVNTVYNAGGVNLNVPIGAWKLSADLGYDSTPSGATLQFYVGLSTTNNAYSDKDLTEFTFQGGLGAASTHVHKTRLSKGVVVSSATPYYAVNSSGVALGGAANLRGLVTAAAPEYSKIIAELALL